MRTCCSMNYWTSFLGRLMVHNHAGKHETFPELSDTWPGQGSEDRTVWWNGNKVLYNFLCRSNCPWDVLPHLHIPSMARGGEGCGQWQGSTSLLVREVVGSWVCGGGIMASSSSLSSCGSITVPSDLLTRLDQTIRMEAAHSLLIILVKGFLKILALMSQNWFPSAIRCSE